MATRKTFMLDDERPLWERQYGETDSAWEWFVKYRDFGEGRNLAKVQRKYGAKESYNVQLQKWKTKYRWSERCMEFDREVDKRRQEERLKSVAKTTREMAAVAESMWKLAAKDLVKWHKKLQNAPDNQPALSPADLRSLVDTGMKLHRLNLNEPESVQEHRHELQTGDKRGVLRDILTKSERDALDELIDSLHDDT